jgi:hypothetical protein
MRGPLLLAVILMFVGFLTAARPQPDEVAQPVVSAAD